MAAGSVNYCWYSFFCVEEKKHLTLCIIAKNSPERLKLKS